MDLNTILERFGVSSDWNLIWSEIDYLITPSPLDEGSIEEAKNVLKTFMSGDVTAELLETSTPKENIFYCYWLLSHDKPELLLKFVEHVPEDAYFVKGFTSVYPGATNDPEKAFSLFQKCVEEGDNRGYLYLGAFYKSSNEEKMLEYWMDGAQNSAEMCYLALSSHYFEKNEAEIGLSYLEQGAESGSPTLQHRLGQVYRDNGATDSAIECFNQSAASGSHLAILELFTHYMQNNDISGLTGLIPLILLKRSPFITIMIRLLRELLAHFNPEVCQTIDELLATNFYPKIPERVMAREDLQLVLATLNGLLGEEDVILDDSNDSKPEDEFVADADEAGSSVSTSASVQDEELEQAINQCLE